MAGLLDEIRKSELLAQAQSRLQGLLNIPTAAQQFMVSPTSFMGLLGRNPLPRETGFAAGATGLPAQEMSVLDPNQAPYMQGYSQGEPVGYAGLALPLAAPAVVATGKALAPKLGQVTENYMVRQGMIQPMMIGPSSELWNPQSAFEAAKLLKQGVPETEVFKLTGTAKGLDNAFRQEISDENALIKGVGKFGDIYEQRKAAYGVTTPTVEEIMRHPQLFEAYPQLKNIQVKLLPKTSKNNASYSPKEGIIRVNPNLTQDQASSSMLHELQHGIQEFELFNKGTDAAYILKNYQIQLDEIDTRLTEANRALSKAVGTQDYASLMKARDKIGKEYRDLIGTDIRGIYGKAMDEYKAYGGEAEARMTQARQKLTAEERKAIYPFAKGKNALDINPDDAIIQMQYDSPTIIRKELLQQLMNSKKVEGLLD
jgi:hypothetical protein